MSDTNTNTVVGGVNKLTETLREGREVVGKHGGAINPTAGYAEVIAELDELIINKTPNLVNLNINSYIEHNFYPVGTYTPPEGYDGFNEVNLDLGIAELDINANGTYDVHDPEVGFSGLVGWDKIKVNVPSETIAATLGTITYTDYDFNTGKKIIAANEGLDGFTEVNLDLHTPALEINQLHKTDDGQYYEYGVDAYLNDGYTGYSSVHVKVPVADLETSNLKELVVEYEDWITGKRVFNASDDSVDGYSSVNLNNLALTAIEVSQNGTYYAGGGDIGYSSVTVNVQPIECSSNNWTSAGYDEDIKLYQSGGLISGYITIYAISNISSDKPIITFKDAYLPKEWMHTQAFEVDGAGNALSYAFTPRISNNSIYLDRFYSSGTYIRLYVTFKI